MAIRERVIVVLVVVFSGVMLSGCGPSVQAPPELAKAVVNGDVAEVESVLDAKPELINSKFAPDGDTLLHWAVQSGNKEVVELLVTKGADLNAKSKLNKCSPLCEIVGISRLQTESHREIAKYLISNGASTRDCRGFLSGALMLGWYDLAKLAIDEGANVKEKDRTGNTPLHLANNKEDNREFTELLIAMGADINAKNREGVTPLHNAVRTRGGRVNVVELLLANGAEVNVKTKKGETPLDWANKLGHKDTADLLRKHGAKE